MSIRNLYMAPKLPELKRLGYYQQYVSYSATDEIIAHLTSYSHPMANETLFYLSNNKQSLAHPVRHATSIYAYGLDNLNQFGGKLDNVLLQSSRALVNCIFAKNMYRKTYNKFMPISYKRLDNLSDIIYTACKTDANMILNTLYPEPIDTSNGWYSKLLAKRTNTVM